MHLPLISVASVTALLLTLIPLASAADCYGDLGAHPSQESLWPVRERLCGPSSSCTLQPISTTCTQTSRLSDGVGIIMTWRGSDRERYCWDATENIINQCFRTNGVTYEQKDGETKGTWSLNGEDFTIEIREDARFRQADTPNTVVTSRFFPDITPTSTPKARRFKRS